MGQYDTLAGGRARFVAAMLESPTITAAADTAGISRNTAHRWIQEPEVRAAIRQAQGAMLDKLTANIGAAVGEAVKALRDVVTDTNAQPAARVGAARTLATLYPTYVELGSVLARLDALEQALHAQALHAKGEL